MSKHQLSIKIFGIVGLSALFFILPNVYTEKEKPEGKEIIKKYCSEFNGHYKDGSCKFNGDRWEDDEYNFYMMACDPSEYWEQNKDECDDHWSSIEDGQ